MKLRDLAGNKLGTEENFDELAIDIHLAIIEKYGWIPLDQMREMPIPMVQAMLKRMEKEYQEMKKMKGKRGR